jgi:hypothetical protein
MSPLSAGVAKIIRTAAAQGLDIRCKSVCLGRRVTIMGDHLPAMSGQARV